MKKVLTAIVALMMTAISFAQSSNNNRSTYGGYTNSKTTTVSGYTRSNGSYVNGYTRTQRNSTNHDNFSSLGNRNPYTGTMGSRAKDYSSGAYNYGSGHTIQTGSRGGQYYVNSRGNRIYVPKR